MSTLTDYEVEQLNLSSPLAKKFQIGTKIKSLQTNEDTYLTVGAAANKTTDVDENVAGLSSAITLYTELATIFNAHYADSGESGEEHLIADTALAAATPTSVATLITAISEMQDSYVAHDDDAIEATPTFHQAQGTERALASAVNPTTLATCVTVINDIKAKFDLHVADSTAHTAGDSTTSTEEDAANGAAILVVNSAVASGDVVVWAILDDGTANVTGVSAVAGSGSITFTFSAAPGADAIISYQVLRATS